MYQNESNNVFKARLVEMTVSTTAFVK